MDSSPTLVDWLTLGVASFGALTGIAALFVSIHTANIASKTQLQIARQTQHFAQFDNLMRSARQLDGAATALTSVGRNRDRRPVEARQASFDVAYEGFMQAQEDISARAPADLRKAAGSFGNVVISFASNPGEFSQKVIDGRRELERLIRRELGVTER